MATNTGLIGLGTMGAALALNIVDNGFDLAVYNRTAYKTEEFMSGAGDLANKLTATFSLEELVNSIEAPRTIILMVPAGSVVDDQIAALAPLLDKDDLIVDAGNANFHDTNRRAKEADGKDYVFLGLGVSGGEEGARFGPSMMAGGAQAQYDRIKEMLEAISAKHTDNTPCVGLMGEGGAGHFVKMVHNGIEYADMQMIAEAYGILRDGQGASAEECGAMFERFNEGILQSYLIEISAKVSKAKDSVAGGPLLDIILDAAGQKGTGRWTVIEAQHMGTAIPVIEAAVTARNVSARKSFRAQNEKQYGAAPQHIAESVSESDLESALIAGKIICYAQGFDMLSSTQDHYGWSLPLPEVAKVWRQGCIIRSAMLDDMASALSEDRTRNLIMAPYFADLLAKHMPALRRVVAIALSHGISTPALAAALTWFDAVRTARGTANMIQAQRDFFGLHSFKRLDKDGDFHGPWAD